MKENHMNYYYLQRIYFRFKRWFHIDTISSYNFQDHICIVEIVLESKRKTVLNSIVFSLYDSAWCARSLHLK